MKQLTLFIKFSVWLNFKGGQYQAGGLSLLKTPNGFLQGPRTWLNWSNELASIENI